jgi:hypothetical protein
MQFTHAIHTRARARPHARAFTHAGGLQGNDSYVAKLFRNGTVVYLVEPDVGLAKVYSPTVRSDGTIIAADSLNNRLVSVACSTTTGASVSCEDDAAAQGVVSTLVHAFYPRAAKVVMGTNQDGQLIREAVFFAGGNNETNATYLAMMDLMHGGGVQNLSTGQFNLPHCVTIDPTTLDIWVCDKGADRVASIACLTAYTT